MVIVPCSIKTVAALATGYAETLIARAGDVTLKEGRPLVAVVRETPLHVGHLRQMLALAEMGAVILPPIPGFYHRPKTVDDIVNHTVARILDRLGSPPGSRARVDGRSGIRIEGAFGVAREGLALWRTDLGSGPEGRSVPLTSRSGDWSSRRACGRASVP